MAKEIWDLWFPGAGATGVPFARARVDGDVAGDRVLVHAAPPRIGVDVRGDDGALFARGEDLERGAPGPMSFLVREGGTIRLEDGWPADEDIGRLVILPGGEAGVLKAWWHADDRRSWRWNVEFSNSLD
jgi:hypothetical protein